MLQLAYVLSLCNQTGIFLLFLESENKFKFTVAELAPKSVNLPCCCAASTYLLCFEVSLFLLVLISFSPSCTTLKLLPYVLHKADLRLSRISEWIWIYYTTNLWISHIFIQCFNFFTVHLLFNVDMEQKIWKLQDII